MVKFDMFNGKRDDMRLVEKQLNKWYDDLIWCPSQCYYYFMHDDDMYCIYLRWRHQNPWTAEIIKCAEGDFNLNHESSIWKFIKIPYFEDCELEKLKEYIMARLDIITALWPHCEHHISLRLEDYKILPHEVREQVQKTILNLVASNKLPGRKIKTHHIGEIKGFDVLLQMEVRDYIECHKEELGIGDGLYINPDTVDITVTNIKQVTDHANFYPFTSLAKYDRTDGTYSVDKDATYNIAFTYYEYQ